MPTVDASSPSRVTSSTGALTATSASFTPPANSVLVACLSGNDDGTGTIAAAFSSSPALTWTVHVVRGLNAGDAGAQSGVAAIGVAVATTSQAYTVTGSISGSAAIGPVSLKPYAVTGADTSSPVGAVGENSSTTNNITPTVYTSTVAGSLAFAAATDWQALGAPTSTDTEDAFHVGGQISGMSAYKATDTPTVGTAVTINFDAGGTGAPAWNWVSVEVKPAAGGGTDATASPATIATTAALPRPAVNVTAGPATIVATVALPAASALAGGGATATPATIACTATLPQPAVNVTAGPAVIPVTVTMPQGGVNAAAGPQAIATTVTILRPAVASTVGATTIAATVSLPTAVIATAGSATATPSTVAVTVALPRPGVNVTAGPVAIQATVTLPQPAAGTNTVASPATIATITALPAAALNVAAGPSTVVLTVTLPLASIAGTRANATSVAAVVAAVASVAAVSAGLTSSATVGRSTTSTPTVSDG